MSDCLHCDINDLVEKRLEREGVDLADWREEWPKALLT